MVTNGEPVTPERATSEIAVSETTTHPISNVESPDDATEVLESGQRREKNWRLGGLAIVDQGVVSVTNFLTTVLVARSCTEHELGIFALAFTIVNLIKTAQERMISAPYLVFTHRPDIDSKRFLGSNLVHQLLFSSLSASLLLALAGIFAYRTTPVGFSTALTVLTFAIPFVLIREHIRAVCAAHYRFHISLVMNITILAIQLGGIGLLAKAGWISIPAVFGMLGIACLVAPFVLFKYNRRSFVVDQHAVRADWSISWHYARWLVLARSLGIAGHFIVPWIVAAMLDESAAGRFAICVSLVDSR